MEKPNDNIEIPIPKQLIVPTLILTFLSLLGKYAAPVWIGVSFVLFALGTKPSFDWWSVITWVCIWVLYGILFVYYAYLLKNINDELAAEKNQELQDTIGKKSKFQKKLDDMLEENKKSES